jgi:hypothetical protein
MMGRARPLLVPPRGWVDRGVMRRGAACGEGRGKGSWPSPTLVLGVSSCSLARPRSFGLILASVPWAARAVN